MEVSPPKVSIITVVFNGMPAIEATVQSVVNLSYPNIEYIVIDGGSTDGTLNVLRRYSDRIYFWDSKPDKGIYDAMNKGVRVATGDWINFMNSGDRFASVDVLNFYETGKFDDADILYGDATIIYPGFQTNYPIRPLSSMWKAMPFCHQATFVRAGLMKTLEFNTALRLSADFEFILRAYKGGKRFRRISRLICLFDFREGASRKSMLQSVNERRDAVLKYDYSLGKRVYYILFRMYVRISIRLKSLFGHSLTTWITKSLKG